MSSKYTNIRKTLKKLSEKTRQAELSFDVQKTNVLDDDLCRVIITVPSVYHNRMTDDNMALAVASAYDNEVRFLPKSLHRVSENNPELFGAFFMKNRKTMPMEQASASTSMTQINDTVFQDEDDGVWTVMGAGKDAYLVSQSQEDIASLLGAVKTRAIATASVGVDMSEDFARSDILLYYNPAKEEVAFGVAANGRQVFDVDSDSLITVASDLVLAVNDSRQNPTVVAGEVADVGDGNKAAILEYMRTLYGHNKDFYNQIRSIITQHVVV